MLDSASHTNESPIANAAYPAWARPNARASATQSLDEAAFYSGAALGAVHSTACHDLDLVPMMLWRNRLALDASSALTRFHGRPEDLGVIRDNWYLRDANEDPGPAGDLLRLWRELGTKKSLQPLKSLDAIVSALSVSFGPDLVEAIKQNRGDAGTAVYAAAMVAARVRAIRPDDVALALWLADAVLAARLKWIAPLPLLPAHIKRGWILRAGDLLSGDPLWLLQCHHAYTMAAARAFDMMRELERKVIRFEEAVPKLRTKGSDRALRLFLTEDAFAPGSSPTGLNARSARRLCERLVSLGAVRELTGRSTFRLYGL